jgi:glutaredoxin 3
MNFFKAFFSTSTSPAMSNASKQKVQQLIDSEPVVVFAKSWCGFCRDTRSTLSSYDAQATIIDIDDGADEADIQAALLAITGQRTVPNIFINHKHIGGNSDLKALANSGKLKALLEEAGTKA